MAVYIEHNEHILVMVIVALSSDIIIIMIIHRWVTVLEHWKTGIRRVPRWHMASAVDWDWEQARRGREEIESQVLSLVRKMSVFLHRNVIDISIWESKTPAQPQISYSRQYCRPKKLLFFISQPIHWPWRWTIDNTSTSYTPLPCSVGLWLVGSRIEICQHHLASASDQWSR